MTKLISKETFDAFQSGDHSVFRDIVNMRFKVVKEYIRLVVRSEMDAEEIAQDVFVILWNNREKIYAPEALNRFLFKISMNESLEFLKRMKARKSYRVNEIATDQLFDNGKDFSFDAEKEYQAKELELKIRMKIDELPEQRKKVFLMSRGEGLSYAEISDKMNISVRTVEDYIYKTLRELKDIITLLMLFFTLK